MLEVRVTAEATRKLGLAQMSPRTSAATVAKRGTGPRTAVAGPKVKPIWVRPRRRSPVSPACIWLGLKRWSSSRGRTKSPRHHCPSPRRRRNATRRRPQVHPPRSSQASTPTWVGQRVPPSTSRRSVSTCTAASTGIDPDGSSTPTLQTT